MTFKFVYKQSLKTSFESEAYKLVYKHRTLIGGSGGGGDSPDKQE